jgi:hypothetical protein
MDADNQKLERRPQIRNTIAQIPVFLAKNWPQKNARSTKKKSGNFASFALFRGDLFWLTGLDLVAVRQDLRPSFGLRISGFGLPSRLSRSFAPIRAYSRLFAVKKSKMPPSAQSQRDCSYQPWVASNELPRVGNPKGIASFSPGLARLRQGLPWVVASKRHNPERVASVTLKPWYATFSGLQWLFPLLGERAG